MFTSFGQYSALLCSSLLLLTFILLSGQKGSRRYWTISRAKIGGTMDKDCKKDYGLLPCERYILQLVYAGWSFKEIIDELDITGIDLNIMIETMMDKLHISEWHQLVAFAWHLAMQEPIFTKDELKSLEYLKIMWEKRGNEQH
jgi:DNA-binding CsgD family transcriptional regulator